MQNIAMENNLAETAFYINKNNNYHIRWFTPSIEVDLCGHATLAAAYVMFTFENYNNNDINFNSKSGNLNIRKDGEYLTMNIPTDTIEKVNITEEIKYDLNKISYIKARGIIITAKGNDCDFVSRFFAPQSGINEDPVTGSAHTTLTPYWSKILNKNELIAFQLSKRKGLLICRNKNDRTEISGKAITYMIGEIKL
jgi:predicted PhzF superfamily epimerase YddE/YHI9